MNSGYFYAPYIPLVQTPIVLSPEEFQASLSDLLHRRDEQHLTEEEQYWWDSGEYSINQYKEKINWLKEGF